MKLYKICKRTDCQSRNNERYCTPNLQLVSVQLGLLYITTISVPTKATFTTITTSTATGTIRQNNDKIECLLLLEPVVHAEQLCHFDPIGHFGDFFYFGHCGQSCKKTSRESQNAAQRTSHPLSNV